MQTAAKRMAEGRRLGRIQVAAEPRRWMAAGVGVVRARVGMKTAAGKKMPTASSLGRRRVVPLRGRGGGG